MKSAIFQINNKNNKTQEQNIEQNIEQNSASKTNNEKIYKEKVNDTNTITSKKPKKLVENIYYFD